MVPEHGEDLGHGVYASPGPGGELTVTSPRLDLGWKAAEGRVPGTAVLWREQSYEVAGRIAAGKGAQWTLRVWNEQSAMRNVFKLSRDSIQELADRAVTEKRNRRARGWTLLALPLLGFAPAALQKKWANEWGFAADRATLLSAIIEMLAGAAGTVQLAAAAFGADFFMPPFLALPGPLLFVFGAARLAMVFGDGEPVGSPLGAPLLLFVPDPVSEPDRSTPSLRLFEDSQGVLELESPILRQDWDRDGLLRFRGGLFRLDVVEQQGRSWLYRFKRDDRRGEEERLLRLKPHCAAAPARVERAAPPSFLRTMLMTAALTLGPASDQKRWAAELGIHALWLTLMGSVAELVGGIANLQEDLGMAQSWLVAFDLFLVGEGLLRLGSVLMGRPMGSVFGWALRPLYRRHLPPIQ